MPFCKRTVAPRHVWKSERAAVAELADARSLSLCAALRQLADLSRLSVSLLEELELEMLTLHQRSVVLHRKVCGLHRYVSSLATKPPPTTSTNLDAESKRAAHFRSSWQQHVNVFSSWSRPECVQQLHQEAELNLQSLLQDFEEQLYDHKVTGQTFRRPSSLSSDERSPSRPPSLGNKGPEFVFLPASEQVSDSGTPSFGIHTEEPTSADCPAQIEKQHRQLRGHTPTVALGEITFLDADLILQDSLPEASQARLLTPSFESSSPHQLPRKTFSNLDKDVQRSPGSPTCMMEHVTLMCTSPSWNGPKGSTFSPSWDSSYDYMLGPGSVNKPSDLQHHVVMHPSPSQGGGSALSVSSGSNTSSFTSISMEAAKAHIGLAGVAVSSRRSDTEGISSSPCRREGRPARPGALRFRERSLSTPTDSGSLCSADTAYCSEVNRYGGESYALMYPSGSSEDGASADSVSLATAEFLADGRPRTRSRSISLRKSKKKPPPPVRSVSLVKNLGGENHLHTEGSLRERRPKSLYLPRDNLLDTFQPDFLFGSRLLEEEQDLPLSVGETGTTSTVPDRELELSFPNHWQLNDWKSNDPYRSLSSSSTATGTTVIECLKARGSSESLDSPGTSRATSPSQFSVEAESKISPFKPLGLMSPSSGYSSQSETPTPTISSSHIAGPFGCKMRPKIPERKSSLPATSPMERAPRSRLSFELPATSTLEAPAAKQKASRRHSDTSAAGKPGQKLNSNQPGMPMVTQTDLKSVRLRSVGRSEFEDSLDGSSDIIEEEQGRDEESPPVTPSPKPKPPVAVKPPLPKRPINLMPESPSTSPMCPDSPPTSPKEWRMPLGNIYMVVRKPKPKKNLQSSLSSDLSHGGCQQQEVYHIPQGTSYSELPSPSSPEREEKNRTLTSSITVSCLAELDKKRIKVPPPVPKKPNLLMPLASSAQSNGTAEIGLLSPDCPSTAEDGQGEKDIHSEEIGTQYPAVEVFSTSTVTEYPLEEDAEESSPLQVAEESNPLKGTSALHISEDLEEGGFCQSSTTHTTEDLFTIIHRSKRKVLGRREPSATFGSRPTLVSPVRSDPRAHTLGATPRSNSRNQNFMALLQRKGSKASSGSRVSAMELLKSTNPLARRVTEFSQAEQELGEIPKMPLQDQ